MGPGRGSHLEPALSRTQDRIRDDQARVHGALAGSQGGTNGAAVHDYTRREPERPERRTGPLADRLRALGRCPDCGHPLDGENHRELCGGPET